MLPPVLDIQNNSTSTDVPADEDPPSWLAACLRLPAVKTVLDSSPPALALVYLDKADIASLNLQYRHKPNPTNVLSFPSKLPDFIKTIDDGFTLGDLAICPEIIKEEALQQNKPLLHHYAHMVIHGFLHLLGFDHVDEEQAREMESLEIKALAILNIPNPYEYITSTLTQEKQ